MHRIVELLLVSLLLSLLVGCGTPGASGPQDRAAPKSHAGTLMVFAAASLAEAFGEIGRRFEQSHGTRVTFNFAGSQQLAQQLAQGAPADVFASANQKEMDHAITAGVVVSGTQRIFAHNRLMLIVPQDNPGQIDGLRDLARPGVKLVLAAAQVPVGGYTQAALASMSGDPAFGADFQARVNANVVSQEENVKAVVTKVSLGEADAGVVYASDVTPATSAQLSTIAIPDEFNQLATYPIAPTTQPPAGAALAETFIQFVLSAEGQQILARYHFVVSSGR